MASVPLDYFNASAGVAQIALGRYNATSPNRKGSVFLNPGGPGAPGVSLATVSGPDFQQICYSSPAARQAFIANTVLDRGYDVAPDVTDEFNRYHLIQTQRDADGLYKSQFEICNETMGEQIRYMGTSTVVRDIDFITTLLDGEDALINFYGLSYGSAIGQYLVNMLPDRVGHVVIDGILDAVAWSSVPSYKWERHWQIYTDDVYKLFMSECAKAGPSQCALSKHANETGADVLARVEAFVNNLYYEPLASTDAFGLPVYILGALISPTSWPSAASDIAQALVGNGTAMLNAVNEKDTKDLERSAVSCNDAAPFAPPTPQVVIDEQLYDLEHVSRFSLAVVTSEPDAGCQFWPVTPPERFEGPWNRTLKNPMLIISNTVRSSEISYADRTTNKYWAAVLQLDPATPLTSGQLAQERQGNASARLLVQDGPGHTSLALPSVCKAAAVRAYFDNGTLPAVGTLGALERAIEFRRRSWEAAEKLPRDGLISPVVNNSRARSRGRASRGTWLGRMAVLAGLYLVYTAAFKGHIFFEETADASIVYRIGDVKWGPCTGEGEVEGAECGFAIVPLDYTDRDAGVAKIALGRYKSTSGNRKGSVFLNPGGPGSPGKWLATQMGPYVHMLCFPGPGTHFAFIANTVLEHGFDVGPNLTDSKIRDHLIHQQREADALWQTQMQVCEQTMGDKLRYMGTVNIARDIEFITSLLDGEDAPMFPDRVGRVVLDGVVDAVDWTSTLPDVTKDLANSDDAPALPAYKWGRHLQTSSETAYKRFMSACAEVGPLRCALAKKDNEDPDVIMSRVESFIEHLHFHPLAVPNATAPGILTSGRARLLLFAAIEAPELWSIAALALDMAMNGDGSAALDVQRASIHYDDLQRSAISCNDNTVLNAPTAEEVVDEHLWVLEHVTRFSLAGMVLETDFGCHHWPVTPPERFSGPWNHTLRNPILIVSNTADPITPLATGQLVNDRFGSSSRLLVQDSAGHCALAMPSLCMIGNMRAFFADGTLPEEGTVCPMDGSQFPDPDGPSMLSVEDKKRFESARRVAKAMLKK
ncbi:hypothetical protein ACG7TL_001927 [Trametes sanguinea]